ASADWRRGRSNRQRALPLRIISARSLSITTPPTPISGCSGYSRLDAMLICPLPTGYDSRYIIPQEQDCIICKEVLAVVRCPECATEIDVDEDEVEEGEILACPEC